MTQQGPIPVWVILQIVVNRWNDCGYFSADDRN